jgi:hypothetical protein
MLGDSLEAPKARALKAQGNALGNTPASIQALKGRPNPGLPGQGDCGIRSPAPYGI